VVYPPPSRGYLDLSQFDLFLPFGRSYNENLGTNNYNITCTTSNGIFSLYNGMYVLSQVEENRIIINNVTVINTHFSLGGWYKLNSPKTTECTFFRLDLDNYSYTNDYRQIMWNNTKFWVNISGNLPDIIIDPDIFWNIPHFLCCTYSHPNTIFYLDGDILNAPVTASTVSGGNAKIILSKDNYNVNFKDGYISNFFYTNEKCLTQQEIQYLVDLGPRPYYN
jgi:hypothetical protein